MENDGDVLFSLGLLAFFIVLFIVWLYWDVIKEWWRERRKRNL